MRDSPVAITRHEELVQWKLAVKVLANFLDALRVSRLAKVGIKPTWIAVQQVLTTTEVLPRSSPHRWWNPLPTALFYLGEAHMWPVLKVWVDGHGLRSITYFQGWTSSRHILGQCSLDGD